jgi:hypothetical protein
MATLTTIVVGHVADALHSDASAITDEHFTSAFDSWVVLAHPDCSYGSILVRTDDNVTTYILGVDYQINYRSGEIKVLSGGSMADATAYHISYVYPETWLAGKINAVTTVAQAAGKFYVVKTAEDNGLGVAVIVTEV